MTGSSFRFAAAALALTLAGTPFADARPFDEITAAEDVTLSTYEQVYIAPVGVELDPDTRRRVRTGTDTRRDWEVSARDQALNAAELQEDLELAFGKKFTLANAPGPDILTVEATIIRLVSTRPPASELGARTALSATSFGAGGADYSVRLQEGDVTLVEITEKDQSSLTDGIPRVGIWQDAHRSFSRFSRRLARYAAKN